MLVTTRLGIPSLVATPGHGGSAAHRHESAGKGVCALSLQSWAKAHPMTPTMAQISSNRDGRRLVTNAIVRTYTDVPACRSQTVQLQGVVNLRCRDGKLMQSSNNDTQALHSPVEQCSSSQTSGWLQAEHEWLSAGSALGYCCTPCSQAVSMTSVESGALTI